VVEPLDAVFARFALNFMTDVIVAVLLFTGIIWFNDLTVTLDLAVIAEAFALGALLGLGVGTLNCVLFGLFPTWKNVWSVLTRPLFILSGVLFLFEDVPANFRDILWYNPVAHVISLMRSGFYGTYDPVHVSVLYVLGIAAGTFVIGGYLLRRYASQLIED
jgi:capsular polysaccharide transport system permease protein